MTAEVALTWPAVLTGELAEQSHALIGAVTALGGAIGWMDPPSRAETDEWLVGAFARIAVGDGAMCTTWRDGRLVAMGGWLRDRSPTSGTWPSWSRSWSILAPGAGGSGSLSPGRW